MKTTIGHEIPAEHKFAVLYRRAPIGEGELPAFDKSFFTRGEAHHYIDAGGANGADGRFTVRLDDEFRGGTYRTTYQRREIEL
jgi:hypothetical protein